MHPRLEPPPVDRNQLSETKVSIGAPIATWEQVGAIDTAVACETARRAGIESSRQEMDKMRRTPGGSEAERLVQLFYFQALDSRCVPADHNYPPRK